MRHIRQPVEMLCDDCFAAFWAVPLGSGGASPCPHGCGSNTAPKTRAPVTGRQQRLVWVCLACHRQYDSADGADKRASAKPICEGCGGKQFKRFGKADAARRFIDLSLLDRFGDTPEPLKLELPWPPSANHLHRSWNPTMNALVRRAQDAESGEITVTLEELRRAAVPRVSMSKAGWEYRDQVAIEVRRAMGNRRQVFTGPVELDAVLHPPRRGRCDVRNYAKALEDALEHAGVYLDDEQIDDSRYRRGHVVKGGSVRATLSPIPLTG